MLCVMKDLSSPRTHAPWDCGILTTKEWPEEVMCTQNNLPSAIVHDIIKEMKSYSQVSTLKGKRTVQETELSQCFPWAICYRDDEVNAIERRICYSFKEREVRLATQSHTGEHRGWSRGRWVSGNTVQSLHCIFCVKEAVKLAKQLSRFRIMLFFVAQSCPTLCDPTGCSLPGSSVHGDSPGKSTGVGCHDFLQGFFSTHWLNPGLRHCRQTTFWATRKPRFSIRQFE